MELLNARGKYDWRALGSTKIEGKLNPNIGNDKTYSIAQLRLGSILPKEDIRLQQNNTTSPSIQI